MRETQAFDIGDTVQCDVCSIDYTLSEETGGFVFAGNAVCPKCAVTMMPNIKRHNEAGYINARANEGESFRDFILRYRGGDNTVTVTSWDPNPDWWPMEDLKKFKVSMLTGHEGDEDREEITVEVYAMDEDDAMEQAGRKHSMATVESVKEV